MPKLADVPRSPSVQPPVEQGSAERASVESGPVKQPSAENAPADRASDMHASVEQASGKQASNRERVSRRQVDKFAEKRDALAGAALQTLAELGYARTSLREIAQNSGYSHGVLHYYFSDKVELIMHCVKQYKAHCVLRYDQIISTASTSDGLAAGFAAGLAETAREDASMHRLWYDLRSQSMFEPSFREDVLEIDDSLQRMIWRIVSRYAELSSSVVAVTEPMAYALFDGLFQRALLHHLAGAERALPELSDAVLATLPRLMA